MPDRTPPNNLEAERASLGAVLIAPDALFELTASLVPTDFFLPSHREIYEAMLAIHARQKPVEIISVADELKLRGALPKLEGGETYLVTLAQSTPTADNVSHYVGIVRDKAALRRFISWTAEQQSRAYGDEASDASAFLDEAEGDLFALSASRLRPATITAATAMPRIVSTLETRLREGKDVRGVPTGLGALDRMMGGLWPEHLVVVGGRPGMGKTALVLNWAAHAAIRHGLPVLIFSLEMSGDELLERILGSEARVPSHRLRTGELTKADFTEIYESAPGIARASIEIEDRGGQSISEMTAKTRRWRADTNRFPVPATGTATPLGLVVVDYVQLAEGRGRRKSDSREQEVGEITRGLKALAKAVKLPVVAISQLNRDLEKRTDKRPQLSDLRESGSIEQDADEIIFVHRDSYFEETIGGQHPSKAEIILRKNRHGDTGTVNSMWLPQLLRFDGYAEEPPGGGSDRFGDGGR